MNTIQKRLLSQAGMNYVNAHRSRLVEIDLRECGVSGGCGHSAREVIESTKIAAACLVLALLAVIIAVIIK
ncbi:MAG: hypothetical protein AB7F40_11380 [Victivallaceae bacterium]